METLYLSDCCGEYLADEHVEYEVCPRCKEHCEVLTEDYTTVPMVDEDGILWYVQLNRRKR